MCSGIRGTFLNLILPFLTKRNHDYVADGRPFPGLSWSVARCGARNDSVQAASLKGCSPTPLHPAPAPGRRTPPATVCKMTY